MKYKFILFDYDQTLANTKDSVIKIFSIVADKYYDLKIDREEVLSFWGLPFPEFLVKVLRGVDTFENLSKKYYKERENIKVNLFENVVDTVNKLVKSTNIGILTSSVRRLIMDDLEKNSFPIDKMSTIQTAEDTIWHKPDPKVFKPLLENYSDISKKEILYVGDSIDDYHASTGAGLDFIAMYHNNGIEDKFQKLGATGVENFVELEKLLLEN